jgi:hypothetical protein
MLRPILLAASFLLSAGWAHALEAGPEKIPFEGGTLTITETEDMDKVLAFDGKELARNYVVFHDRMVEVGGMKVALFSVGDGGNACGAATVIVWRPENGIQSQIVGEDCGSPPAAVTDSTIYFVPYLMPGATDIVQSWTPQAGLKVAGTLSFTPQPGTGWADLDPAKIDNIIDTLQNEAVYAAAQALLGDKLVEVTTGLLVGGGAETVPSGAFYASGCVPHACGSADAFMAVDAKAQKLYFAQKGEQPEPSAWPALAEWPADLRDAMHNAIGGQQ